MKKAFLILATALLAGAPLAAADAAYRDEALKRIDTLAEKFTGLAGAVPAESYTWRPMDGVRSVSEVYLHISGANYGLGRVFGAEPPEGFNPRGYEKSTTDKAKIIDAVKASFAHFRAAIAKLPDDGDKPTKMFGQETTMRGAIWMALEHLSEHLGQSIAYARSNRTTPPWTAARGGD